MRNIVITLGILLGIVGAPLVTTSSVGAINLFPSNCSSNAICKESKTKGNTMIKQVIDLLFYAVGIIAVVVIIVGGIKFITADGDASKIKSARETIMYAVVGLVVTLLAYSIVQFVVGRF